MRNAMTSYIRVLHAAPNAPAVDVYANDKLVAKGLQYRDFTPYISVSPSNYTIKVYPAGKKDKALLEANATIAPQSIYTLAAVGEFPNISILPIEDPSEDIPSGQLGLRFAHLSPNAPKVDVSLTSGAILFEDVGYKESTGYIPLDPGTYAINITPAGSDQVVLYVPNIKLKKGNLYTIYAIGLAGKNPPLQVLIPLDGNTYIKF